MPKANKAKNKIKPVGTLPNVPVVNLRVYDDSDTWTKPNNLSFITVEVIGGGGGGGAAGAAVGFSACAGGGGAGGRAVKRILAADLGASETITVGAGGDGGSPDIFIDEEGQPGGTSSFGKHVSASGGKGGDGVEPAASWQVSESLGAGGIGLEGELNTVGAAGERGFSTGKNGLSGKGADSPYGSGGRQVSDGNNGGNAMGHGAGGSGAATADFTALNKKGGNGVSGLVIVWEWVRREA